VHHTSIEEILEGDPVTADMFPVNQHLAVVLFDSGSSHSFMSEAFAQKHDQPITELGCGYRISSVLGILNANRKIRKRTDTDVAFTGEYSRVSIFHRECECTN